MNNHSEQLLSLLNERTSQTTIDELMLAIANKAPHLVEGERHSSIRTTILSSNTIDYIRKFFKYGRDFIDFVSIEKKDSFETFQIVASNIVLVEKIRAIELLCSSGLYTLENITKLDQLKNKVYVFNYRWILDNIERLGYMKILTPETFNLCIETLNQYKNYDLFELIDTLRKQPAEFHDPKILFKLIKDPQRVNLLKNIAGITHDLSSKLEILNSRAPTSALIAGFNFIRKDMYKYNKNPKLETIRWGMFSLNIKRILPGIQIFEWDDVKKTQLLDKLNELMDNKSFSLTNLSVIIKNISATEDKNTAISVSLHANSVFNSNSNEELKYAACSSSNISLTRRPGL